MDSGSAVPTLNPGWSETLAEKLRTVASVRCGVSNDATWAAAGCATAAGAGGFRRVRKARCLALESAGNSIAARTAMIATTIMSSMRVKAWRTGSFIAHLVG